MAATRKDVAKYANVSVATVSNVVNGTKFVSDEIKKRVEEAIQILDYHPNMVARGLAMKQTRHVAIMVDNLKNGYYTDLLEGAQAVASEYGYIVSVILVDYTKHDSILELASRGLDGVIIATVDDKAIKAAMGQLTSVTMTDLNIDIDYSQGMDAAISALKKHGHKDIAFLSGLRLSDSGSHPRWDCFRRACQREGIQLKEKLIIDGNEKLSTDENAGIEATARLLAGGEKFTAIVAVNDLVAIGAMRELHRHGIRVPEDVSIIGCDNSPISSFYIPSLSTMDVQTMEVGKSIMYNLIQKIQKVPYQEKVLSSTYIERESVRDI